MYQPMLFLHWKQIRAVLALFVIAAFALPLLSIQGFGTPPGMDATSLDAYRFVESFRSWLPFFPLLAGAIGFTLALSSWNWDHQLNHVYALSLPLTRWEHTLLKMAAGATLALLPTAALWLSAHLATASITLPTGLHAYPNELALRFFFAVLVCYAMLFALAAGTIRTTLWIVGGVIVLFVGGAVANALLADQVGFFARHDIVQAMWNWVVHAPGPFEVLTGNWSLIDV